MIRLTRLNGDPFLLNPDLIEHVEVTPDTVINLTTGHQFMVRESAEVVASRVLEFRRAISQPDEWMPAPQPGPPPGSAGPRS
ncbi:MAG TPA: flagellar FlbD family protein [Bryobacteraceae bacterium]|nr:flagellar FlbD family protein [Bryobacteraceae bacterium]